jgi:hypothetical protein
MLVLSLLSSCTTQPQTPGTSRTGPPKIEFFAVTTSEQLTGVGRAESAGDRVGEGMSKGATAGVAGGAVAGAAMCGPWFLVCLGITAGIGAVAGMTAGAAYGFSGVSTEDALYVNEALSHLDQEYDFQQELLEQLEQRLPATVQASPELADAQVVVQLDRIDFVQHSRDNIRLESQGSMILGWKDGDATRNSDRIAFSAQTPEKDIDDWLADDGRQLGAGIRECIEELASGMSARLLQIQSLPELLEKAP